MMDGMTKESAYRVIGDLRDFTHQEYAGQLAHIGDDRYVVVYGIRRELDTTNCFTSPADFVRWRAACVEQGTFAPTVPPDTLDGVLSSDRCRSCGARLAASGICLNGCQLTGAGYRRLLTRR